MLGLNLDWHQLITSTKFNYLINCRWRHSLQCLWTLSKDSWSTATNYFEERQCSNKEAEADKNSWSKHEFPSRSILISRQDGVNGISNVFIAILTICLSKLLLAKLPTIPSHGFLSLFGCLFSILWSKQCRQHHVCYLWSLLDQGYIKRIRNSIFNISTFILKIYCIQFLCLPLMLNQIFFMKLMILWRWSQWLLLFLCDSNCIHS